MWPALKPLPAPSKIITLVFLSLSSFFKTFIKLFKFLNDNELYVLGSLIVTIDMPSIELSKEIQEISATKIRAKMREEGKLK